jgi:hypothetical protein
MIRMDVGVDNVREPEAFARRERDVFVDIVGAGVDDGTFADCAAAKEIGGATEVVVVIRPKDHGQTLRARIDTLLTPHFSVAPRALFDMN